MAAYTRHEVHGHTDFDIPRYPTEWLFDPDHDDDWCDHMCAYHDMYDEILRMARKHGCVTLTHGGSRIWYVVHPSLRHPGMMQVTCWDERGPIGHANVDSGEGLAFEVNWNSVTVTYEAAALAA